MTGRCVHQWDPGSILWRAFMGSIPSICFFPITLFLLFPSFFPRLAFIFFPSFFCHPLILPPLSPPPPPPAFLPFFLSTILFPFVFFLFTSCFPFLLLFFLSFLPLFYFPDFFLLFLSSLFLILFVFSFSPLNFFLVSPLYQGGCYEHKG